MDEISILTTLMLYVPIGLLTLLQVAEAGRRTPWHVVSTGPSQPPDTPVTNRNFERDPWVQTHRACASISYL